MRKEPDRIERSGMKYWATLLLLIAHNASAKGPKTYDGPLGLSWSMNIEAVDSLLSQFFERNDSVTRDFGITTELRFIGPYADFVDCTVIPTFFESKLVGVAISIPKQGEFPITKTWRESVKMFGAKYGKPSQISEIPAGPGKASKNMMKKYPNTKNKAAISQLFESLSSAISDDEYLDSYILQGNWVPLSMWEFSNASVFITTSIVMRNPEEEFKDLSTMWMFSDKKRSLAWEKRIKTEREKHPSDF